MRLNLILFVMICVLTVHIDSITRPNLLRTHSNKFKQNDTKMSDINKLCIFCINMNKQHFDEIVQKIKEDQLRKKSEENRQKVLEVQRQLALEQKRRKAFKQHLEWRAGPTSILKDFFTVRF